MEKEKYLEDLSEIRSIMDRSSRFISLSGLSGVLAGIYALIGAALAYRVIYTADDVPDVSIRTGVFTSEVISLIVIAGTVLVLAVATGVFLSIRKARKLEQPVWAGSSRRMVETLLIPLVAGGVLIVILLYREMYFLVSPLTLVFYGLALVNASKYTLGDVKWLGICEVVVGIISAAWPDYGLYLWAFGFGVLHILYGVIMYMKYDK